MATLRKPVILTPEEYLEGEQHATVKHEYLAGQAYAMVGVSRAHNRITMNLAVALQEHLRGGPCEVYVVDVKVRTENAFFYPDVVVTCDPQDRAEFFIDRPVLVVEVLSPSTETRDTFEKRIVYQALASLREYVLIAQDRQEARIYRRIADGWELETLASGEMLRLDCVDLRLPLAALYAGVNLA